MKLKSGQPVAPECFDCVTVYYHEIIGFEHICKEWSKTEIVGMLNALSSAIDQITSSYDVHKVGKSILPYRPINTESSANPTVPPSRHENQGQR